MDGEEAKIKQRGGDGVTGHGHTRSPDRAPLESALGTGHSYKCGTDKYLQV